MAFNVFKITREILYNIQIYSFSFRRFLRGIITTKVWQDIFVAFAMAIRFGTMLCHFIRKFISYGNTEFRTDPALKYIAY